MSENFTTLISAAELNALLDEEASQRSLKIFDVRGAWGVPPITGLDDYKEGHIPGAVFLDWSEHFVEQDVAINLASVASKGQAQRAFENLGISIDDTVVLYDDYHHMLAGRTWWSMRYWGFKNIRILNGGWKYWQANSFPSSTQITPQAGGGDFIVFEQAHLGASIDQVANRNDEVCLFDGRGPIGYAGSSDGDERSGHIPGAVNVPFKTLLDEATGLFKSQTKLQAIFDSALDGRDQRKVISSCGAGYAGSIVLLGLDSIGVQAPLFDGSFSMWKLDVSRAVER